MLRNEEIQHFITTWNFLNSPGSFNNMTRDMMRGRLEKKSAIISINPLQDLELKKDKEKKHGT